MRRILVGVAFVTVGVGVGAAASAKPSENTSSTDGRLKRGTYQVVGPETMARTLRYGPGPKHRTIFVNGGGATVLPGANDSCANTSSMVKTQTVIPPSGYTSAQWNELMTCLREVFAPYAVTVTDVEPPCGKDDPPFIESIVGGSYDDIQWADPPGAGTVGVAPLLGGCNVAEGAITFNLAADVGNDITFLCGVVAQETAHALGLDHSRDCRDPMTYLPMCAPKWAFQDVDAACGEFADRPCKCGPTQNTHRILLETLGPADAIPPTVAISEPADGAEVDFGFLILAEPRDETRVDRVEFYVDGTRFFVDYDPVYKAPTPFNLTVGSHTIKVVAVDGHENKAEAERTVTIRAQCQTNADCPEGGECQAGRCLLPIGAECVAHEQCLSSLCYVEPSNPETGLCSKSCSLDDSSSCPEGSTCTKPENGTPKCLPSRGGGGGLCAAGARGAGASGGLAAGLLVLGALALAGRRARRTRR